MQRSGDRYGKRAQIRASWVSTYQSSGRSMGRGSGIHANRSISSQRYRSVSASISTSKSALYMKQPNRGNKKKAKKHSPDSDKNTEPARGFQSDGDDDRIDHDTAASGDESDIDSFAKDTDFTNPIQGEAPADAKVKLGDMANDNNSVQLQEQLDKFVLVQEVQKHGVVCESRIGLPQVIEGLERDGSVDPMGQYLGASTLDELRAVHECLILKSSDLNTGLPSKKPQLSEKQARAVAELLNRRSVVYEVDPRTEDTESKMFLIADLVKRLSAGAAAAAEAESISSAANSKAKVVYCARTRAGAIEAYMYFSRLFPKQACSIGLDIGDVRIHAGPRSVENLAAKEEYEQMDHLLNQEVPDLLVTRPETLLHYASNYDSWVCSADIVVLDDLIGSKGSASLYWEEILISLPSRMLSLVMVYDLNIRDADQLPLWMTQSLSPTTLIKASTESSVSMNIRSFIYNVQADKRPIEFDLPQLAYMFSSNQIKNAAELDKILKPAGGAPLIPTKPRDELQYTSLVDEEYSDITSILMGALEAEKGISSQAADDWDMNEMLKDEGSAVPREEHRSKRVQHSGTNPDESLFPAMVFVQGRSDSELVGSSLLASARDIPDFFVPEGKHDLVLELCKEFLNVSAHPITESDFLYLELAQSGIIINHSGIVEALKAFGLQLFSLGLAKVLVTDTALGAPEIRGLPSAQTVLVDSAVMTRGHDSSPGLIDTRMIFYKAKKNFLILWDFAESRKVSRNEILERFAHDMFTQESVPSLFSSGIFRSVSSTLSTLRLIGYTNYNMVKQRASWAAFGEKSDLFLLFTKRRKCQEQLLEYQTALKDFDWKAFVQYHHVEAKVRKHLGMTIAMLKQHNLARTNKLSSNLLFTPPGTFIGLRTKATSFDYLDVMSDAKQLLDADRIRMVGFLGSKILKELESEELEIAAFLGVLELDNRALSRHSNLYQGLVVKDEENQEEKDEAANDDDTTRAASMALETVPLGSQEAMSKEPTNRRFDQSNRFVYCIKESGTLHVVPVDQVLAVGTGILRVEEADHIVAPPIDYFDFDAETKSFIYVGEASEDDQASLAMIGKTLIDRRKQIEKLLNADVAQALCEQLSELQLAENELRENVWYGKPDELAEARKRRQDIGDIQNQLTSVEDELFSYRSKHPLSFGLSFGMEREEYPLDEDQTNAMKFEVVEMGDSGSDDDEPLENFLPRQVVPEAGPETVAKTLEMLVAIHKDLPIESLDSTLAMTDIGLLCRRLSTSRPYWVSAIALGSGLHKIDSPEVLVGCFASIMSNIKPGIPNQRETDSIPGDKGCISTILDIRDGLTDFEKGRATKWPLSTPFIDLFGLVDTRYAQPAMMWSRGKLWNECTENLIFDAGDLLDVLQRVYHVLLQLEDPIIAPMIDDHYRAKISKAIKSIARFPVEQSKYLQSLKERSASLSGLDYYKPDSQTLDTYKSWWSEWRRRLRDGAIGAK